MNNGRADNVVFLEFGRPPPDVEEGIEDGEEFDDEKKRGKGPP